ncbi:MAG: chromosomal replication initiator protein DnaA [Lachnospiraceae bacterium]|nr:chromosomal replication initiator protein DnaA [Lachnospiraceae bacterium]
MSEIDLIQSKWLDIIDYMINEYDITKVSYETWIKPLKPGSFFDDTLNVLVPADKDDVLIDFVTRKYARNLEISIEAVTSVSCKVRFKKDTPDWTEDLRATKKAAEESEAVTPIPTIGVKLNPRYTFDTFVVGANNKFAHAASLAVAENPAESFNPLFIYGGVGLGKTHLMHSIAHMISKNNPSARIVYVTSETFTNELIEAIGKQKDVSINRFREKYRQIDVLLIDDIQFVIGKQATQEEFFHTFNYLFENGKQIVLSSDKPSKDFDVLDERLRSRFQMGLSVDITPPDYETRMAILRKKEEIEGYNIDNGILQYIASNIASNIRVLEGALTTAIAYAKLNNRELTLEVAQEALKDMILPGNNREVTLELIINTVADHFNLQPEDICSPKRTNDLVFPRHICMYLSRKLTKFSLEQIAMALNKKDHSTVINGCDKIEEAIKKDESVRTTIDILTKKITPA